MPFVRATDTSRHIVEPVVVAVAAPKAGNKINKIPNEDSQYAELDDTNVLDIDRYAGYDRNDTGVAASATELTGTHTEQSSAAPGLYCSKLQIQRRRKLCPSDYNKRFSDYVGRIYANPNRYLDMNYRFRLDKDDLDMKYSELSARIGPEILNAYVSYIYLQEMKPPALKTSVNVKNFTPLSLPDLPEIGASASITARI